MHTHVLIHAGEHAQGAARADPLTNTANAPGGWRSPVPVDCHRESCMTSGVLWNVTTPGMQIWRIHLDYRVCGVGHKTREKELEMRRRTEEEEILLTERTGGGKRHGEPGLRRACAE